MGVGKKEKVREVLTNRNNMAAEPCQERKGFFANGGGKRLKKHKEGLQLFENEEDGQEHTYTCRGKNGSKTGGQYGLSLCSQSWRKKRPLFQKIKVLARGMKNAGSLSVHLMEFVSGEVDTMQGGNFAQKTGRKGKQLD